MFCNNSEYGKGYSPDEVVGLIPSEISSDSEKALST